MISLLDSTHQRKLMKKWRPILEAGEKISSDYTKLALAQVLENTTNEFRRQGVITEGIGDVGVNQAGIAGTYTKGKGVLKGKFGRANNTPQDMANSDYYMPNIVMPMLRRIFPTLIANELVGVQPLNGPIGFALALRAKYNKNGILGRGTLDNSNKEIGFNPVDTRYTGLSVATGELSSVEDEKVDVTDEAWKAYAGTDEGTAAWTGTGAPLGPESEFASMSEGKFPTVSFDLIKTGVEAKTRKLGAAWSPELSEDMQAMHGIDVEAEMINILSYEIGAEIDRQILTEMVKAAITGGSVTKWSPAAADALDQMGRLYTLLTQITVEANNIAIRTRRGNANFVVTSPKVCALLQQLSLNKFVSIQNAKDVPSVPDSGVGAIQKQGLINDGQQLLVRDAYAAGDYVLMGYKGTHPGDSGIIYCPYIPVQLSKVLNPDTFTPQVGARTRYGVMSNPWDAKNYYAFIKVQGLTDAYSWNGTALAAGDVGRHFLQDVSTITNGTIFA